MARKAREKSSTGIYAVLLRGENENIFKSKKSRELFEKFANNSFGGEIFNIEFKNDRVVMIVSESDDGLGNDMKPVLISFARAYNKENALSGKVFKDRFKSVPLNSVTDSVDFAKISSEAKPKTVKKVDAPKPKTKPEPKPEPEKRKEMPSWLL